LLKDSELENATHTILDFPGTIVSENLLGFQLIVGVAVTDVGISRIPVSIKGKIVQKRKYFSEVA
jgi:hypothetical protein